jgi:hypothetical protein
MEERRRDFVRGLNLGDGHSEANLLHRISRSRRFVRLFPGCLYQYSFLRVSSRREAASVEEWLIKNYVQQFGEVPPLNSVIPRRYGAPLARPGALRRRAIQLCHEAGGPAEVCGAYGAAFWGFVRSVSCALGRTRPIQAHATS